jgi:hypothetical protein
VFENRVLRRVFGPKRDGIIEKGRKIHNKELKDLYPSPNIIRVIKSKRMRWAAHVAHIVEGRAAYRNLAGKPKGMRPLVRPRSR